ncbi:MAG TPA: acyl carrier protein [Streptosporangiaceae bacterium]|nr:acyl carrier protein [Streptosporangiaceae bacterium]
MSDIRERLNALMIAKFDLEPGTLADDPTLESLDFDSLAIVQLAGAMEREFGVEVDDEKLTEHTTVSDIVQLLGDRLGSAARLGQFRVSQELV